MIPLLILAVILYYLTGAGLGYWLWQKLKLTEATCCQWSWVYNFSWFWPLLTLAVLLTKDPDAKPKAS